MNRIIKEIDRKVKGLIVTERHERYDGNNHEADRLCEQIKDLIKLKDMIGEIK